MRKLNTSTREGHNVITNLPTPRGLLLIRYTILGAWSTPSVGGGGIEIDSGDVGVAGPTGHCPFPRNSLSETDSVGELREPII